MGKQMPAQSRPVGCNLQHDKTYDRIKCEKRTYDSWNRSIVVAKEGKKGKKISSHQVVVSHPPRRGSPRRGVFKTNLGKSKIERRCVTTIGVLLQSQFPMMKVSRWMRKVQNALRFPGFAERV